MTKQTGKILFHDFKHHLGSGIAWLQNQKEWSEEMNRQLLSIGASQLDYYTGSLDASLIEKEVETWLGQQDVLDKEKYLNWNYTNGGFREVIISDNSRWTLRMIEKENFIHLHPARYSPHTIRVKANTLKTVLCVLALKPANQFIFDMNQINRYRTNFLNLSPVKVEGNHTELENIFNLFLYKLNDI